MGARLRQGFMWPHRSFIYNNLNIGRRMLRFESLCKVILHRRHDIPRYSIRAPIFQPSAETSNSTSSGASTDQDFIEDYPKIGVASTRILLSKLSISVWWDTVGHLSTTVTTDIQPSGDLKCTMHGHPATKLSGNSIWTSTSFYSRPSWSRSNV
jgi:hypothetical protein